MKFIVKSEKRQVRICIDISLDKPEESAPIMPPSEPTIFLEDDTPIYLYIAVVSTTLCARWAISNFLTLTLPARHRTRVD